MTDLSQTIIARSDQLNADDLIGGPRTVTITRVTADPSSAEQPVTVHYEGENGRPFKPCKSMRRVMVAVWGAQGDKMVGQSMTLYRDPSVQFGGLAVGGIRISHMTGIDQDKQLALMVTRGRKAPYKVKPLKMEASAPRGVDRATLIAGAEKAAAVGMAALEKFWGTLNTEQRRALRDEMDRIKRVASDADAQPEEESDPFGLPRLDEADDPAAAGRAAFATGTPLGDVPEHYGDDEADAWRNGWLAAEREAEA